MTSSNENATYRLNFELIVIIRICVPCWLLSRRCNAFRNLIFSESSNDSREKIILLSKGCTKNGFRGLKRYMTPFSMPTARLVRAKRGIADYRLRFSKTAIYLFYHRRTHVRAVSIYSFYAHINYRNLLPRSTQLYL